MVVVRTLHGQDGQRFCQEVAASDYRSTAEATMQFVVALDEKLRLPNSTSHRLISCSSCSWLWGGIEDHGPDLGDKSSYQA